MQSIVHTLKNEGYETLVQMVSKHTSPHVPQSILTMSDEAFRECYEYCYERKRILHQSPQSIDLRKKNNYVFKYQHMLPLEYHLSAYLTYQKIKDIMSIVRYRLERVYPFENIPRDTELVFFSTRALGTNVFETDTCIQRPIRAHTYCHGLLSTHRHPSDDLSPQELKAHHVFETWPEADWDWTMLSKMPHIATEDNVFLKYPHTPWDWYVLSKERADIASYENVFLKYPHAPWDWRGLSWQKHLATPENVCVKHADKPWKREALNHHDYWSIPLLKKYHVCFPLKWSILIACNPHLITYDHVFMKYRHSIPWNWFAVSACPHVATYENVFLRHPDAPWVWSVLSQQSHIATYENVFVKHAEAPWDWSELTMDRETIGTAEHIFVKFPEKPWDARVVNARRDLVTRRNVFEKYPQSHLWDFSALFQQVDLLFDADDEEECKKKKAAVDLIEKKWWRCLIDPKYLVCRQRLMREFSEMENEIIS